MTLSNRAVSHLQGLMSEASVTPERYVLGDLVGRGGMGVVYRAFDHALQRDVAIKLLDANSASAHALAPETVERLRREAGILAQLEHPGIVPVHDIGMFDD